MKVEKIIINSKEEFLDFFREKIFHLVLNKEIMKKIKYSGEIKNSKEKGCIQTTCVSARSYGYNKGFICLFNFKTKKLEKIPKSEDETIISWLEGKMDVIFNYKYAFIFKDEIENEIINGPPSGENLRYGYIPSVEVWYEDRISLDLVDKIIEIELKNKESRYFGNFLVS